MISSGMLFCFDPGAASQHPLMLFTFARKYQAHNKKRDATVAVDTTQCAKP
jgi:hypothetical protein